MIRTLSLFIVPVLFFLQACGEAQPPDKKTTGKPPVEPPAASAPAAAKPAGQAAVTDETRELYQWYCAQCHGVQGKGDGVNALLLTVPPRDHTKKDYLETRTDQQLFDAIQKGGLAVGRAPCMPAWGHTLKAPTIRSLVRYIRELCDCEAL